MAERGRGGPPDPQAAVYVISVAAELTGLHPQTLRTYERLGLILPGRTAGGGRRYSHHDIELLRTIAQLTGEGIGLEGVRRILALQDQVAALRSRLTELAEELDQTRAQLREERAERRATQPSRLPVLRRPDPGASVVVWRRGQP